MADGTYPVVSEHIDVVHETRLLFGMLQQGMAGHNASIVDYNAYEAMLLAHSAGQLVNILTLDHIAYIAVGSAARLLDILDRLCVRLLVNIPADDLGTNGRIL